jgi:hypothetical protein
MKDLSLHLMDIVQNSITAGADHISLNLSIDQNPHWLICEIIDNGCGMEAEFLEKVTDPFKTTRTTRDVGLGLPLLKLSAEMTGGKLALESEPGKGTTVRATFSIGHIDRIPLGDIPGTITMLIATHPHILWTVNFTSDRESFILDTDTIKKELDDVPITHKDVLEWIQNTISEGIRAVFGGVLDEVN